LELGWVQDGRMIGLPPGTEQPLGLAHFLCCPEPLALEVEDVLATEDGEDDHEEDADDAHEDEDGVLRAG